jgi:hypothetical protein
MIVGIILLFSTALIFYIRSQITEGMGATAEEKMIDVPIEIQPIKIYVDNCIEQVSRSAVENLGRHGGYPDPWNSEVSEEEFLVTPEPTESDGITIFDMKNFVPYWIYLKSANDCSSNCEIDTFRLPLRKNEGENSVELQIDRYVNAKLPECINDFAQFKKQGFEFETGAIEADTRVTERDVAVFVTYPITVKKADKSTKISRFTIKLDVNLRKAYELATMLMNVQSERHYLETHTMNMLSMYSYPLSNDRLPPIAEFSTDTDEFFYWTRSKTKTQLEKNVLPVTASYLRVENTSGYSPLILLKEDSAGEIKYDRIGTGIMRSTEIPLNTSYPDLRVSFTYLDMWPIYLKLNDDEVIMARTLQVPILSFLSVNQYEVLYTLAYPVLVTLEDKEAFNGEGYKFMFAMEHNLRYNEPLNTSSLIVDTTPKGTMVCGENQKNSKKVMIEVKEIISGDPVENARVQFVFGSEACRAGITQIVENKSVIIAELPTGLGEIRVLQKDYMEYSHPIFISPNRETNFTAEITPYTYINGTVFSKPLEWDSSTGKLIVPAMAPIATIQRDEKYTLIFERQDDDNNKGYKTFGQGSGGDSFTLK